jgi:hypothetical protein
MFTYALARISSIGVFPEQAATRQRDVRLVNSCSAVMLLIAAANMTVDGIADIWQFVLFDAAAIFMSALPLLLNKLQQYGTARWTLLFVSQLAAFTTPTLPGPAAHGEVIFASSLVLTMVVLHRHSRYALFSMTLFSVAGYALLQIYGHHLPRVQLSEAQVIYARVSLTLSSFALIVFLLHAALTLSRSLEEEIAEKSREIDEARKQAESALLVRSQFVSSMNSRDQDAPERNHRARAPAVPRESWHYGARTRPPAAPFGRYAVRFDKQCPRPWATGSGAGRS